jgi:hypothetical protein
MHLPAGCIFLGVLVSQGALCTSGLRLLPSGHRLQPLSSLQSSSQLRVQHSLALQPRSDSELSIEDLSRVKSLEDAKLLVSNNGTIFKIHSLLATFFGAGLLLFPDAILGGSGPVASFAYQQWAVFILAVAYVTKSAGDLDSKAQQLLARAFFVMCSAEALLYTKEILTTIGRIPFQVYAIDISSLIVFLGLALGYFFSGLLEGIDQDV